MENRCILKRNPCYKNPVLSKDYGDFCQALKSRGNFEQNKKEDIQRMSSLEKSGPFRLAEMQATHFDKKKSLERNMRQTQSLLAEKRGFEPSGAFIEAHTISSRAP